ncbi:MAG: lipoyl(octanoyl) transferase LipB [Opitutae bacterium]|nr:lipoyl(octanoyl) transferase LipB [Opitutae bacterium]
MEQTLKVIDWGIKTYSKAIDDQIGLVETKKNDPSSPDFLIFTEHDPVFTIGSKVGAASNLLWDEGTLKDKGIQVHKTNRGGDITYHGPGQLIIYPIIQLKDRDLHAYLRKLEMVIIRVLQNFNLEASTREGKTGIWIGDRKICAIGVAVKSWITYHGLALNISPDLEHFKGIIPCGITDGSVTSMEQEMASLPQKKLIKERFVVEFESVFYELS